MFIMCLIYALFAFLIAESVIAQNSSQSDFSRSSPAAPPQQIPAGIIAGPIIYNNGIVKPLVDLDLFQYSNLKKNGASNFGKETGAAAHGGRKMRRKSNLEANKPGENKVKGSYAEITESDERKQTGLETQIQIQEYAPPGYDPFSPSKTKIYAWTDKDGVKHFSNDIGSVPPEYRDQVTETGTE